MKTLRKLLLILVAFITAVSMPPTLHASTINRTILSDNSGTIDKEYDDSAIIEVLDSYFNLRKNEYLDCRKAVNDIEHQNYILDWASSLSITIDSSMIYYSIREYIEDSRHSIKVLVYEWVTLNYIWWDHETGEHCKDIMGFGTDHVITINLITGIVENDSYIEINEYEHCQKEDLQYICFGEPVFSEEQPIEEQEFVDVTRTTYSAAAAVAYSNLWCGQSVAGQSSTQNPSNYNPLFYYYGNDCCNFVSQCVYSGGIPMVPDVWEATLNPTATVPVQDINHVYTTHSWISVPQFKNYMVGAGYPYVTVSTTADCLVGNPIFWLASDGYTNNHNMLIVGKHGAAIVLVNAHNKDAYRYPRDLTKKTYHTFDLVHNYSSQPYSYNYQYHWHECTVCGNEFQKEYHTWQTYGTRYRCIVCGMITDDPIIYDKHQNCEEIYN